MKTAGNMTAHFCLFLLLVILSRSFLSSEASPSSVVMVWVMVEMVSDVEVMEVSVSSSSFSSSVTVVVVVSS